MSSGYPFRPKKVKAPRAGASHRRVGRKMRGPSIGHHKPRRSSMSHHALKGSY